MNAPSDKPAAERPAPGAPGIEPRWTSSAKDGVGTMGTGTDVAMESAEVTLINGDA